MIRSGPPHRPRPLAEARSGAPRSDPEDPTRQPFARRDPRERSLRDELGRDDRGEDGEGFGRPPAFAARVRSVLREMGGDEGRSSADELQVLAALAAAPIGVPASMAAAMPEGGDPADHATSMAACMVRLVERLEAVLHAERAGGAGLPLRLEIPLDGVVEGLSSVSVEMTGTDLSVTFTRAQDCEDAALAAAARGLAERLQARFGGRTIRVLERAARRDAPAENPFATLGRLLGPGDA